MDNKTALLIIDVQDFYFPGGKWELENPLPASLNAKKLLEHFRETEAPVIHVRHKTEPGFEIHKNVVPLKDEKIITKSNVNSFKDTDLLDYLKKNKIKKLVICGMQTHMCVEAAVRAAADYGFRCVLIHDACATKALEFDGRKVSAKDVHNSVLSTLAGAYAKVIDTKTFLEKD
jgi:nicotinamidase-related amidase